MNCVIIRCVKRHHPEIQEMWVCRGYAAVSVETNLNKSAKLFCEAHNNWVSNHTPNKVRKQKLSLKNMRIPLVLDGYWIACFMIQQLQIGGTYFNVSTCTNFNIVLNP